MGVICHKCDRECRSKYDLQKHLSRKVPCDAGKVKCDGCDLPFSCKKALKLHVDSGRCKGKRPAVRAQELADENQQLKDSLHQHQRALELTNSATAATVQRQIIDTQNNVVVNIQNIENLTVTNGIGQENLSHLAGLSSEEYKSRINLTRGPQAFADWCKLTRTDEEYPANHNALLLHKDAKEMACCREGKWAVDEKSKIMLELLRCDMRRMYNQLGRLEHDPTAMQFRNEFLLHDMMTRSNVNDTAGLQPAMDAMAGPIIDLTRKFYVRSVEQPSGEQQLLEHDIESAGVLLTEFRCQHEQFEAKLRAHLLSLKRRIVELAIVDSNHASSSSLKS